jgi:S1-C subfamily serine protease
MTLKKTFYLLAGVMVLSFLVAFAVSRSKTSAASYPDAKTATNAQPGQDPQPKAQLGVVGKPGFIITKVVPGTTAEQIGLRRGDVILRIDGRGISSGQDISQLIYRQAGEQVKVHFMRYDASTEQFSSFEAIAPLGEWKEKDLQ